jgi:protein-S-isoprenylcysteine O-methyltransferase Ste14
MYVAFMVGYVGLSLLADAPAMLLLGFVLFYILDQRVIVPEENYLTEKFGTVYTDYKDEVRRWV